MVLIKIYERLAVILSDGITKRFVYNVIIYVSQVFIAREDLF